MMNDPVEVGRNHLMLECGCYAEYLEFDYYDWDEPDWREINISHVLPSFYALQYGSWERIKKALQIIWAVIRGKEYTFFSININKASQVRQLKEFLDKIDLDKMMYSKS